MGYEIVGILGSAIIPDEEERLIDDCELAVRFLRIVVGPEPKGVRLSVDKMTDGVTIMLHWTGETRPQEYSLRCKLALEVLNDAWEHMEQATRERFDLQLMDAADAVGLD